MVVKPVFILGCGRSGTTLLFDLLSQHPGLARTTGYPDGEDHDGWINYGRCVMAGIGNNSSPLYGRGINGGSICASMTREDVSQQIKKAMHSYYQKEVLKGQQSKRVLNKCPHNSNKVDYLLALFPDAKIIHVVRDCEPVVASWIAVMQEHPSLRLYLPEEELPCFWIFPKNEKLAEDTCLSRHKSFFPGGGEELFVNYWIKTNLGIDSQIRGFEQQRYVLRYEDLVADAKVTLSKLLLFCELPQYEFALGQIRARTEEKHKHRISPRLAQMITDKACSARERFGYCSQGPVPVQQALREQR